MSRYLMKRTPPGDSHSPVGLWDRREVAGVRYFPEIQPTSDVPRDLDSQDYVIPKMEATNSKLTVHQDNREICHSIEKEQLRTSSYLNMK